MGAIGIARAFAYGGFAKRNIFNPNLDRENISEQDSDTIQHFYDKLLLLKEKFNTRYGSLKARERHTYIESFLKEFYKEWDGRK